MSPAVTDAPARSIRVVVISGLSGSGKSTAIHALEDMGFFCIDNLPVVLMPKLIELFPRQPEEIEQIALVVDARESRFLDDFKSTLERVTAEGGRVEILFLDCSDECLQRRYSETRRRHPLSDGGAVEEGIRRERQLLDVLRKSADRIIDTSRLNPHQLKQMIQQHFTQLMPGHEMNLALVSFGFKHGIPPLSDLVFDVRFLPNPYFDPELRHLTGLDEKVSGYVLRSPLAQQLVEQVMQFITTFRPHYDQEGKSYLTVAIGCTGGRHRSVAIVEELGHQLKTAGQAVAVRHRNLDS